MNDFYKRFLLEDPRRLSPTGRYVALAAFGKHPGWDDHVEGLGLETESLNLVNRVLYVNGIGGQIDSGGWEKLDAAQQVPGFKHVFVWQRSGQMIVGRFWSSSDGKGRTHYPMVVCLHFTGVTLSWALKEALPVLAELEAGCIKTTSAEDVRNLFSSKRGALRETLESAGGGGEYAFVSPEVLSTILQPTAGAKPEGFFRVLYQIQSHFGAFTPAKIGGRAIPPTLRAQQLRLPFVGRDPEQALLFWSRFFLTQVDASVPLLLSLRLEADWLDVTAGKPESPDFFCLRASPKAVPMVSEIPYTIDDDFRAKAAAFLDGFQRGETKAFDLRPPEAGASGGGAFAAAKSGWLKWLGAGVILILGAITKIAFALSGNQLTTRVATAGAVPTSNRIWQCADLQTLNARVVVNVAGAVEDRSKRWQPKC